MVIYPTLYILMPKLLFRQKYLLFFLALGVLLFGVATLTNMFQDQVCHIPLFKGFCYRLGYNLTPIITAMAMAITIQLLKYYYLKEQEARQEQNNRMQAELELLKSNIHPNFLFNTLNNLVTHTKNKSSHSPQIILKLSDLLRFMIYESRCNFIPLHHEIELLRNFIGLEKLRYGNEIDISFECLGDVENKMIRPLLLLPLVENALNQVNGEDGEQKWASVHLHSEGRQLIFKITYSRYHEPKSESPDSAASDSIRNVRERLKMLYANSHSLSINDYEDMTHMTLELQLIETDTFSDPKQEHAELKYAMEIFPG
jgi:LytS/YehU family sensor histidine kinase